MLLYPIENQQFRGRGVKSVLTFHTNTEYVKY